MTFDEKQAGVVDKILGLDAEAQKRLQLVPSKAYGQAWPPYAAPLQAK